MDSKQGLGLMEFAIAAVAGYALIARACSKLETIADRYAQETITPFFNYYLPKILWLGGTIVLGFLMFEAYKAIHAYVTTHQIVTKEEWTTLLHEHDQAIEQIAHLENQNDHDTRRLSKLQDELKDLKEKLEKLESPAGTVMNEALAQLLGGHR